MKPVITPEESARLDAEASASVEVLMERAGLGVAIEAAASGATYGTRVAVLAGVGNNGGDGYVAARYLARRGCFVTIHSLGEPRTAAAAQARDRAVAEGVTVVALGGPANADLIVDALFGAGFRGELPGVVEPWVHLEVPVVAVDVPSGLDAGTGVVAGSAFRATTTVTFHALKPGHLFGEGPDRCGRIAVVDIGLGGGDVELFIAEESDAPRPARPRTAHKWSAGSVAVVGGAPGITGAPLLAARSALNMGAGSVAIVCPRALQPTYAAASSEVMTRGVGSGARFESADVGAVLEAADRFDVMVLGPGLGAGQEAFVLGVLDGWDGPLLLDADGINALPGVEPLAQRANPTVITPHAGEFVRLTNREPALQAAVALPGGAGVVVVLKGNPTLVVGAERWVVREGGPELATIGTGDVLAGVIAALWARGLPGEVAARSGAYWHGRAGAALSETRSVTAAALAAWMGRYAF